MWIFSGLCYLQSFLLLQAEACQMAWDLLTNVYKLNPNRLYVTYYAGGNSIPMDEETKRIWEMIGYLQTCIIYKPTKFLILRPP